MNTRRLAITTALALGVALGAAGAASAASVSVGVQIGSRSTVDINFFYTNLEPYGRWVDRASYGRVYFPRVASSWRPYSQGYWVDTDYGWTWVSEEPFGWATYHYGRWYEDDDYGWGWVPDTEWGPAWVDFQQGNGYVGWAPLPPTVRINYSSGYYPRRSYTSYDDYCFVEERRFLEPRVSSYYVPRTRNRQLYGSTRNVTRYNVINNRFVNRSLEIDHIQRVTGRRVQRYQVTDVRDIRQRPRFRGNQVEIFRPRVERRAQRQQAVAVQQQRQVIDQRQVRQQRVEQQRREAQVRDQRSQRARERQQQVAVQQQRQRQVVEQRQAQNRQRQQQQQIAVKEQQRQRQVAEQRQVQNRQRQQQRLEQQRREAQVNERRANQARQREIAGRQRQQGRQERAAPQQRQNRREAQSQRPPRGNGKQKDGDRPRGNRHREGQGGN